MDRLAAAGCTLATPRDDARRGPQVAVRAKDAAAMTERLAGRGVVVSWREDKVRAMFHAYNDSSDIDALGGRPHGQPGPAGVARCYRPI